MSKHLSNMNTTQQLIALREGSDSSFDDDLSQASNGLRLRKGTGFQNESIKDLRHRIKTRHASRKSLGVRQSLLRSNNQQFMSKFTSFRARQRQGMQIDETAPGAPKPPRTPPRPIRKNKKMIKKRLSRNLPAAPSVERQQITLTREFKNASSKLANKGNVLKMKKSPTNTFANFGAGFQPSGHVSMRSVRQFKPLKNNKGNDLYDMNASMASFAPRRVNPKDRKESIVDLSQMNYIVRKNTRQRTNVSANLSVATDDLIREKEGSMGLLDIDEGGNGHESARITARMAAQQRFANRNLGFSHQFQQSWTNVASDFRNHSQNYQSQRSMYKSSRAFRNLEKSLGLGPGYSAAEERRRSRAVRQSVRGLSDEALEQKQDTTEGKTIRISLNPLVWIDTFFWGLFTLIELIPFDIRIIIVIFGLSGVASFILYTFTQEYERDVLALS
eukprot:maker-scaffold_13-snap-gene-7.2-mRNA-1 protein AED:0.16 eAED:0.16 QI:148/1/1/1/1/1/2/374/444